MCKLYDRMNRATGDNHPGALRGYEWSSAARTFVNDHQQKALHKLGIADNRLSRVDDQTILELAKARASAFGGDIDAAIATIRAETTNDDLPTPFEVPSWYNMLLSYSDDIATAAIEAGSPVGFRPMLATIASGHVNAITVLVPGTQHEYVIMFEAGLFGFLNLISKLVSSVLLTTAMPAELIQLDLDAPWHITMEHVSRFFDVYGAYVVAGNPMYATRYIPSADLLPLHQPLLLGAELFVLGHEYGHIIEGHLRVPRDVACVFPGVPTANLPNAWKEELEADAHGFELMLAAAGHRGLTPELAYTGAEMFFTAIEILECALIAIKFGAEWPQRVQAKYDAIKESLIRREVDLGTHPPPAMRRDYLRQLAGVTTSAETARKAQKVAERVTNIMSELWTKTALLFENLHEDGVKPAKIWRAA
jgi:hypothetical protein